MKIAMMSGIFHRSSLRIAAPQREQRFSGVGVQPWQTGQRFLGKRGSRPQPGQAEAAAGRSRSQKGQGMDMAKVGVGLGAKATGWSGPRFGSGRNRSREGGSHDELCREGSSRFHSFTQKVSPLKLGADSPISFHSNSQRRPGRFA